MTERTEHDETGNGTPEPSKVHTFDLIDEVPGVSDAGGTDGAEGPDGGDGGGPDTVEPDAAADRADEPAPRAPGRVAPALTGARAAVGRTARRGGAAVRRRLPSTRRGKVLLVGSAVSVVVLAVAAGVLVDARLREQALLATPAGVRSLATKPTQLWSTDLENPIAATLVAMPGVLAIAGDAKVRGVDPASGEDLWTVDLEKDLSCGPTTHRGTGGPASGAPADPLVCVTSSGDGGERVQNVTVVEADGATQTRELDPAAQVMPAPGGGLIHFEPLGGEQEQRPVVVDKLGAPHLPKAFVGPDLTVRVEDAATGTERWSDTVAFGAPRPDSCLTYDETGAPVLDVAGALGWDLHGDVLEVQGCGVSAAFLLDGTRLDDPENADDPPADGVDTASFASLPDGGWVGPDTAVTGAAPRDVVHLPHGATVPLEGQALVPWATDGRDPGILLERVGVHAEARSTVEGDAGARLWSAPRLRATTLLARVSGTAVVLDEQGAVRGIDLGTGADRWTLDPEVLSFGDMAWAAESTIFGAYTDGDTLLLPVSADPSGSASGLRLLAVDLRDGALRWEIEQETPYTQLISVDGYLAQVTQEGVVGLG
ncbi:PQQ-binding-like beta-propeller repeat protein [Promicromonospora iranensis]|uniref:Outer membrane protein assembly factor BamB n=1 Tax=Promicromonospora iranensis TaxID=1105144 RepID=A0ABU2CP73_9MICO|nr:PQQ-binding-like beta-propeller repeat protein [Promicromonospora iranensis]MDR7383148.1 outer membrane protein assembly factor BamB [Promicromonospora iranensis]